MQKVLTRSDRIVTLVNYFVCASQVRRPSLLRLALLHYYSYY